MAETLRELVVALSLDSSNFSRNTRTINQQIKEAESAGKMPAIDESKRNDAADDPRYMSNNIWMQILRSFCIFLQVYHSSVYISPTLTLIFSFFSTTSSPRMKCMTIIPLTG